MYDLFLKPQNTLKMTERQHILIKGESNGFASWFIFNIYIHAQQDCDWRGFWCSRFKNKVIECSWMHRYLSGLYKYTKWMHLNSFIQEKTFQQVQSKQDFTSSSCRRFFIIFRCVCFDMNFTPKNATIRGTDCNQNPQHSAKEVSSRWMC